MITLRDKLRVTFNSNCQLEWGWGGIICADKNITESKNAGIKISDWKIAER